MNTITEFLNKWGIMILLLISLITFINTCGTKSKIERLDKKVQSMERTIQYNDSINSEINIIQTEISNLESTRNIIYFWNAVVRTAVRPDDLMNEYSIKIKALQEKLNKIKDARTK